MAFSDEEAPSRMKSIWTWKFDHINIVVSNGHIISRQSHEFCTFFWFQVHWHDDIWHSCLFFYEFSTLKRSDWRINRTRKKSFSEIIVYISERIILIVTSDIKQYYHLLILLNREYRVWLFTERNQYSFRLSSLYDKQKGIARFFFSF